MKKSKFKVFGFNMKQTMMKLGVCFLFAFFFASAQTNAQTVLGAQSYIAPAQAVQVLDQEISEMNDELASLVADTPAYQTKQNEIWYYTGVKRQIDNSSDVAISVAKNYANLSKVETMKVNLKDWHNDILELLSY